MKLTDRGVIVLCVLWLATTLAIGALLLECWPALRALMGTAVGS